MSELVYDAPKYKGMDDFLTYVYELVTQNNGTNISKAVVYRLLDRIGLKQEDLDDKGLPIDIKEAFFKEWDEAFKDKKSTKAFCDEKNWSYWEQFTTAIRPDAPYIKIYVPLDVNHLKDGVISLFSFIDELGVDHASKVGRSLRNDNVVIRLSADDTDAFIKIMDFINNNEYLQAGMNKTNPFLPSVGGVGYMQDVGGSYNGFIADSIANYITTIIFKKERPSLEGFYKYAFNTLGISKEDEINREALNVAFGINPEEIINEDMSREQKAMLLLDAIKETYIRYGIEQATYALEAIVKKNSFRYITNGNGKIKYRDSLMDNVSQEDAIFIVKAFASAQDKNVAGMDIEDVADDFVQTIFSNEDVLRFQKSCMVTLENRGAEWLSSAIYSYITYKSDRGFSRYSAEDGEEINYREEVAKINPDMALGLMRTYLTYLGLDPTGLNSSDLIQVYVTCLERSREEIFAPTSK